MKNYLIAAALCCNAAMAQETMVFEETFETHPLSTFTNADGTAITQGGSPCGRSSVGNTSNFNSTSVDFLNAQNGTAFLGVNPESPCGGFYNTEARFNGSIDLSGISDPIRFRCRYFKSTTLNWGPAELKVTISDGSTQWVLESEFTEVNQWAELELNLPSGFTSSITEIKVELGGGEGVAIDDIAFVYGTALSLDEVAFEAGIQAYPNPVSHTLFISTKHTTELKGLSIYTINGQKVLEKEGPVAHISVKHLKTGHYFMELRSSEGRVIKKFIKE